MKPYNELVVNQPWAISFASHAYLYAGMALANPHAATTINGVTYRYDNLGNL
jgi:hypothetical protein